MNGGQWREDTRALQAALEADAGAGAGVSRAARQASRALDRAATAVWPPHIVRHLGRAIEALPAGTRARAEARRILAGFQRDRAAEFGSQDARKGRPPLASIEQAEEARLWEDLGISDPVTDENAPERWAILTAYADAYDAAAGVAR